jgi:hypothetical protein
MKEVQLMGLASSLSNIFWDFERRQVADIGLMKRAYLAVAKNQMTKPYRSGGYVNLHRLVEKHLKVDGMIKEELLKQFE